jgi:PAS domain S-box-containing protein
VERRLIKRGLNRIILLPIVLSVLYAGVVLWQLGRMLGESEWIQHTTTVLLTASEAQRHIQLQESSLRGYVQSRAPLFEGQFQSEDKVIDTTLQQLHELTLDNRDQARRVDTALQAYWTWQVSAHHALLAATYGLSPADSDLFIRAAAMGRIHEDFQRIDRAERQLYTRRIHEFQNGTLWLIILIVTLSLILGGLVGFYARKQAQRFVDRFNIIIDEATQNRDLIETTLLSIGDAIIVADHDQHITLMNTRAEELTGWSIAEARGRVVQEVFRVVDEDSRFPAENPIVAVLRERRMVEIAKHTLLLSRTGVDYPIEDSAAPVHNSHHDIVGVVLVFRDISMRREAEEQASLREREFRALIENAPDVIISYDRNLCITYVNPAVEQVLGIAPSALLGRRYKDVGIPELVYKPWEQAVRDVFAAGHGISTQTQYATTRGVRYYDTRLVPERRDQELQTVISVSRDITEIVRTEERLRESEERFRNVIESTPDAFYMLRAVRNQKQIVDFYFEYINERGAELITVSVAESIGKKLSEMVPSSRLSLYITKYAQVIESGKPMLEEYHVETKYLRRASWLRSQYVPVGDNLAITTTDITERKQTEDALLWSEQRYRHLVENASEAIFSTDERGRFTYVNPYILDISGYTKESALQYRFDELVAPDHRERVRRHFYRQFISKTPYSYIEAPFVTKFGEERWLVVTTSLQISGEQVQGFDCIGIDITSRKQLEMELRTVRTKAEASERALAAISQSR